MTASLLHNTPFTLHVDPISGALGLSKAGDKYPLVIDFAAPAFQKHLHQALHQGDLLLKAVSPQTASSAFNLLDATAGLGYDGFLLAAKGHRMGYTVDLFEQHPVIYLLLQDALKRALEDPQLAPIAHNIQLSHQELTHYHGPYFKIIYLDPMFPKQAKSKSALSGKAMQYLDLLTQNPVSDERLVDFALHQATGKVILKRPKHAPIIFPEKRHATIVGKSHRFDIYSGVALNLA